VSDTRLIAKIRDALGEAAAKGETASDWKDAVNKLTSEAGVADLSSFTLDTAFNTAMQKAYSAGRLEQMQEPHMVEALPFWQYWTVGDDRVRPEHEVLDGFLARAIDPVWRKIYPPSGFNCRCSVVPIPADEALKIDPNASEGGLERLPMLARIFVPQPGFYSIHAA
jgi:SPP1 gp7 family putative phage head morphogenesis protein